MIAPFVVVMILGSMLPSIDFDVLEYHLQGPKEYYQAGHIALPAPQRLHEHAVRRRDAPPGGDGGDGRLVVGRIGGPASGRTLRPGGRDLDRLDGAPRRLGTSRLVRGDRLPFDSVDLSSGGDRLCRRTALLLSRGPRMGRRPRLLGSLDLAALDLVS